MPERPLPPAGWYDDPQQPGKLRWWDGQTWLAEWQDKAAHLSGGSIRPTPIRGFKWYFSFSGRIRRSEWWTIYSMAIGGVILLSIIANPALETQGLFAGIFMMLWLATMWIVLASNVKRLHDRGRSGWFLLVALIPFAGFWVLIEVGFLRGTVGPNAYGSDPLTVAA